MDSKTSVELPSKGSGETLACEKFLMGSDKFLKNPLLMMNLHSLRDAEGSHKRWHIRISQLSCSWFIWEWGNIRTPRTDSKKLAFSPEETTLKRSAMSQHQLKLQCVLGSWKGKRQLPGAWQAASSHCWRKTLSLLTLGTSRKGWDWWAASKRERWGKGPQSYWRHRNVPLHLQRCDAEHSHPLESWVVPGWVN